MAPNLDHNLKDAAKVRSGLPVWCIRAGILLAVLILLLGAGFAKERPWFKLNSPHFSVLSHSGAKKARQIAREFEQFRGLFEKAFPGTRLDPPQPMYIVVVRNFKELKSFLPWHFQGKDPVRAAGYFLRGPHRIYIFVRTDAPRSSAFETVYHEYVHLLVSLNFERIPLWANEGLAEFYAETRIGKKDVRVGLPSENHLRNLQKKSLLPLTILLTVNHDSPLYNEDRKASVFYSQSWALTHYLMLGERDQNPSRLSQFFDLIRKGASDAEAARGALGDLGTLEDVLGNYIRQAAYRYVTIKTPVRFDEKSLHATEIGTAEILAARGELALAGGMLEEASSFLEEATQIDPGLPFVWEVLGHVRLEQGDETGSMKAFERAVDLGTRDHMTIYSFADLARTRGYEPEKVVASLQRVIELRPSFAPAYAALASIQMEQDDLSGALALYRKAYNADPAELGYLYNVVVVLVRLERFDEAEVLGKHLLRRSRESESDRRAAEALLEQIAEHREFAEYRDSVPPEPADQGTLAAEQGLEAKETDAASAGGRSDSMRVVLRGQIVSVACWPPYGLYVRLETAEGVVVLTSEDFREITYTVGDDGMPGGFQPCLHLEGRSAEIVARASGEDETCDKISSIKVDE